MSEIPDWIIETEETIHQTAHELVRAVKDEHPAWEVMEKLLSLFLPCWKILSAVSGTKEKWQAPLKSFLDSRDLLEAMEMLECFSHGLDKAGYEPLDYLHADRAVDVLRYLGEALVIAAKLWDDCFNVTDRPKPDPKLLVAAQLESIAMEVERIRKSLSRMEEGIGSMPWELSNKKT